MVAGLLGNESSDSNRFTLATPKSENDVRLQATLGNQNPMGLPVGVVRYWSKTGNDAYEVLDGQQRTISVAQYVNKDFPIKVNGNDKFFQNLTDTERAQILDYELTVYICEGTEEEKLEWFKIINIAGETLTPQELLNATYTGTWLADAKNYFSKRNCVAGQMADGYIKGNPIRQDYLEKALL